MTNQEQRTKIKKLLNEIEESATGLTAEQQEAMLKLKGIIAIGFDFIDDIQENPEQAKGNLFNNLEGLNDKITDHRLQNLPSGGIIGAVVPGELHEGGEVAISEKAKQVFDVSANEKTSRDYLESKGIDVDNYVKKGLAEINKIVKNDNEG